MTVKVEVVDPGRLAVDLGQDYGEEEEEEEEEEEDMGLNETRPVRLEDDHTEVGAGPEEEEEEEEEAMRDRPHKVVKKNKPESARWGRGGGESRCKLSRAIGAQPITLA